MSSDDTKKWGKKNQVSKKSSHVLDLNNYPLDQLFVNSTLCPYKTDISQTTFPF